MRFEEKLQEYAQLIVEVGLHVQPNQVCYVQADIEAAQLAELVVKEAYNAGAKFVHMHFQNCRTDRLTYERASDEVFTTFSPWKKMMQDGLQQEDACFLFIVSNDPDAFAGVSIERMTNAQRARGAVMKDFDHAMNAKHNSWTVAAAASPDWAKKVFPDEKEALNMLWNAIFAACRVGSGNATALWQKQLADLGARVAYMNEKKYKALHYSGAGTDLMVELHPQHAWNGGASQHPNDYIFAANLPTEEIFTAPMKTGVNGIVAGTKPLCCNGMWIDGFSFRLENGRIVEAKADIGEDLLQKLIETDEGASYLGEVALVPDNSPISNTGILFYNTLFDENASCHFAFGNAYPDCLEGGSTMSETELAACEMNSSITHVDFMVGSKEMNIDGILADGTREPVLGQSLFLKNQNNRFL
jgi:aminopeptidase